MIKAIRLINFFSFSDCTINLESDLNILVGINGSGKSNFLRAFQLLQAGIEGRLQEQIAKWGGCQSISNKAKFSESEIESGDFYLMFRLDAVIISGLGFVTEKDLSYVIKVGNNGNGLYYTYETIRLIDGTLIFDTPDEGPTYYNNPDNVVLDSYSYNFNELTLPKLAAHSAMPAVSAVIQGLRSMDVYKEFLTSENAPVRNSIRATGINKLLSTGDNMFQVLNMIGLKSTINYDAIESGLHDVNENFQRFRMNVYGQGSVEFYLQEKGLQTPIHASQVSDGTLCYLCLLVALYQQNKGKLILFDEPERNLHPDMLFELAKQLEKASEKSQIILTTHAPGLLNQFPLRAVRVFEKDENNQTIVKKFTEEDFAGWYDEFAPGQMWRNGDLGGNRY